jgi:hypothetical protein
VLSIATFGNADNVIGITLFQTLTNKDGELLERQLNQQQEQLEILQIFEKEHYHPTNNSAVLKTTPIDSTFSSVSSDKVNNKPYN